jgi:hypothetical protein
VFGTFTLTPTIPSNYLDDIFVAKINTNPQAGIAGESHNTQVLFFAQTDAFHLSITDEELLRNNPVLKIYDMTGRVVQILKITSPETSISNSALASGIYSWELYSENKFLGAGKVAKN